MIIEPKELIKKYSELKELESVDGLIVAEKWQSQYDDYSAAINYSVVRELKPKVVVEFGTRTGRCTYDIFRALLKNGQNFIFKPYEIDEGNRKIAQENHNRIYGALAVKIGGDILKATDIPDNIEYLFVDNSHDGPTTEWLFDVLLKKCVPGAIVQIHDIPFNADFSLKKDSGIFQESLDIIKRYREGKLPLKKLYFASEDTNWESSWWEYAP